MDEDERKEFRKKIRQMIEMNPEVKEEIDPEEKRKRMQKLLADYPLVVVEDDPDCPEDADGWGFNFSQFFDKMSVKNVKKVDDDDDSDNEVNWEDIRAIKDITSTEWEETVFSDLSPLVILVHNRYRRPKENEMVRDQLEKAIQLIWDCRIPSPRVIGVEEFMNVSQSEKAADLVKSAETIEVSSPKAPRTSCRTSIRQRVKNTETENMPPTATRTTRRAVKQLAGGVTDMLKTPAISTTIRKAKANPSGSSCQNVNNQLNECDKECLTEKKSARPRVKKDGEKSVKIKSFLEEVNVTLEEDVTVESGNPNTQEEAISNAFEKLDVLPVVEEINQCLVLDMAADIEATHMRKEIKDCGELDGLQKESDDKSNPCEDVDQEEKSKIGENDSTEDENDQV